MIGVLTNDIDHMGTVGNTYLTQFKKTIDKAASRFR